MRLHPRSLPFRPGTLCSIASCEFRADFDVYVYDLKLQVSADVVEESYIQDTTCPFVCRSHMLQNERGALGERRSGGLVMYPHTNRHRQFGYTKYIPIPEVHQSLVLVAPSEEELSTRLDRSGDVEEALLLKERHLRVRQVLAEMAPRDADILKAVFFDEQNPDSICESFGVDRSYLRILLHRAKERFRRQYLRDSDGFGPTVESLPQLPTPAAQHNFDILFASVNEELIQALRLKPQLMRELHPRRFEELIADLFSRRGCTVKLTPATRDGGVDIYAVEHHAFGESLYLIECKRYSESRKVGVEPVRGLYAVTEAKRATRGILVTTSFFTNDAIAFASPLEYRLALRDYHALCEWLGTLRLGGAT